MLLFLPPSVSCSRYRGGWSGRWVLRFWVVCGRQHTQCRRTPHETLIPTRPGTREFLNKSHIYCVLQKLRAVISTVIFTDVAAVGAYLVFFSFRLDLQYLFSHFFTGRSHWTHVNGLHVAQFTGYLRCTTLYSRGSQFRT